jgi:hypothetical protein
MTDVTIDSVMVTYHGGISYRTEVHVDQREDERYNALATVTESRLDGLNTKEVVLYQNRMVLDDVESVIAWLALQSYLV